MLVRPGRRTIQAPSIANSFFLDHEMDNHRLKTWLQLHLATDDSAVTNLPFVLNSLTEEDFLSQGHVQKWIIRINSLIHSKDPGARWAGLSIALRTATLSRDTMNECAHAWITAALPMLFVSLDVVRVLTDPDETLTYRRTRFYHVSKPAFV